MKIELENRLGAKGAWNEGKVVRGDRNIIVDGVSWGHVVMQGHGMHGNSFEFYDADGDAVMGLDKDGKPKSGRHCQEKAHGSTRRSRRDGDERTTDERIIDKARELIEKGRLVHPEELKAKAAQEEAENRAWCHKRDLDRAMMAEALRACWSRTDLTNAEREGLALAWVEIGLEGAISAGGGS